MGLPLHSELGPREPKTIKEDPNWKAEHSTLWRRFALDLPGTWPMDYDSLASAKNPVDLRRHGLLPREREVAVICHYLFESESVVEFMDANLSAPRLIERHLSDDGPTSSPWKPSPPTLVGSGKMVLRWSPRGKVPVLRTLECFELARMIGWPDQCWKAITPDDRSHAWLENVANMCGNAYSLFHFGPWNIALLATYGKCLRASDENDGDGSDGGEAACVDSAGVSSSTDSD